MLLCQAPSVAAPQAEAASSIPFTWCALAAVFGILVGSAEMLARYRDEPFRTLVRRYGLAYLFVNAGTSAAACAFVIAFKQSIFPTLSPLSIALVTGFAAMAVLRSKFFTFRTRGDEDIPIGLDVVVRALLAAVDRGVDRAQSAERWEATFSALHDVDETRFPALVAMLRTNLGSYQNVSKDEIEAFNKTAQDLTAATAVPFGLRAVSAGLAFQAIAGTSNFNNVVSRFKEATSLSAASSTASQVPASSLSGGSRQAPSR